MGVRVALLEETDWLGGQMAAAGVSTMDGGLYSNSRPAIYEDFIGRVKAYYQTLENHRYLLLAAYDGML